MKAITLVIFPVFRMNCCIKHLETFVSPSTLKYIEFIRVRKMEIRLTNFSLSRIVSGRRGSSITGMWHSASP